MKPNHNENNLTKYSTGLLHWVSSK